jgi:hypothetical protein
MKAIKATLLVLALSLPLWANKLDKPKKQDPAVPSPRAERHWLTCSFLGLR